MSEGHGQDAWGRTSWICALIVNVNRDPKKSRPVKPEDFNPYAERKSETLPFTMLREIFQKQKRKP